MAQPLFICFAGQCAIQFSSPTIDSLPPVNLTARRLPAVCHLSFPASRLPTSIFFFFPFFSFFFTILSILYPSLFWFLRYFFVSKYSRAKLFASKVKLVSWKMILEYCKPFAIRLIFRRLKELYRVDFRRILFESKTFEIKSIFWRLIDSWNNFRILNDYQKSSHSPESFTFKYIFPGVWKQKFLESWQIRLVEKFLHYPTWKQRLNPINLKKEYFDPI